MNISRIACRVQQLKLRSPDLKTVICLVLTVTTLVAYRQVQYGDFTNFDDPDYVLENPHVNRGLDIEGVKWPFVAVYSSNWDPLT